MANLPEVQEARAVMTEAKDWSVMKWLSEKKRVRKVADAANARLDAIEKEIRAKWDPRVEKAYASLRSSASPDAEADVLRLARSIRHNHDEALSLRMEAEAIFDKAEKRLSIAMAREGCQLALRGWDAHLEAISDSEKAVTLRKATTQSA